MSDSGSYSVRLGNQGGNIVVMCIKITHGIVLVIGCSKHNCWKTAHLRGTMKMLGAETKWVNANFN